MWGLGSKFRAKYILLLALTWKQCCSEKSSDNDAITSNSVTNRYLGSTEEGVLLPPEDNYNFDQTNVADETKSLKQNGRRNKFESSTVVSVNGISVQTGFGDNYIPKNNAGSAILVQAKPVPIYTKKNSGNSNTVYLNNNCFGSRCPENTESPVTDEWKSYHYVLNQDVRKKYRKININDPALHKSLNAQPLPFGLLSSAALPFVVDRGESHKRISRKTTASPAWVKLEPVEPGYDPFLLRVNKSQTPESVQNAQFSNRRGVELNPESFAERWGWNNDKPEGSRLPNWLQHVNNRNPPTKDNDNRNWVKLEPIPVTGVTISKWVPKDTPSSELPTTGWPSRNRPQGVGGSSGLGTGTKWWDVLEGIKKLHNRPSYWNSNKASAWNDDRDSSNAWNDVIYPNTPGSATASWQTNKDLSKYSSSFPMTSQRPWPGYHPQRRPSSSATGSWSAEKGQYEAFGANRRKPNKHTSHDDPRWVLVSNSRKVTVTAPERYRPYNQKRYRPDFDRLSDFPFYENNIGSGNRVGKKYRDILKLANVTIVKPQGDEKKDDVFNKINATLSNLTPVLNLKKSQRRRTQKSMSFTDNMNNKRHNNRMGRLTRNARKVESGKRENHGDSSTSIAKKIKNGLKINPIYAAVGAGMVPATMAAVLPMVIGRKKRDLEDALYLFPYRQGDESSENLDQVKFLDEGFNLRLAKVHVNNDDFNDVLMMRKKRRVFR